MSIFGLDFIISSHSNPVFLEANDHPLEVFRSSSGCSNGSRKAINEIVSFAKKHVSSHGAFCTLLPEFFAIDNPIGVIRNIDLSEIQSHEAYALLRDLGHMGNHLIAEGVDHIFCCASALIINDGYYYAANYKVDVLYVRAHHFSHCETNTICINGIRHRGLCLDKARVYSLLEQNGLIELLPKYQHATNVYFIKKPRHGRASFNISRLHKDELTHLDPVSWILEEWVEPQRMSFNGRDYWFDLRVNLVCGAVTSIYVRSSALPADSSPDSWLTTTGIKLLVYPSIDPQLGDVRFEDSFSSSLANIRRLSTKISRLLDSHIQTLPAQLEARNVPTLSSILNITDDLIIINLKGQS
jgi:hypothetical protein